MIELVDSLELTHWAWLRRPPHTGGIYFVLSGNIKYLVNISVASNNEVTNSKLQSLVCLYSSLLTVKLAASAETSGGMLLLD